MGAWGIGVFENDDALDWMYELLETENDSMLQDALILVVEHSNQYPEAYESCRALVAAEVVAALKDISSTILPVELNQWIGKHPIENHLLVQLALKAVKKIKTSSELKELWDESDSVAGWNEVVSKLEMRLEQ